MRIIDLHHIELLNNLGVDFQLLFFKWRHDLLAQVNRQDVVQCGETFDFFVRVFNFVDHFASILGLEHGFDSLSSLGDVVKVVLRGPLLLLILSDSLLDFLLLLQS